MSVDGFRRPVSSRARRSFAAPKAAVAPARLSWWGRLRRVIGRRWRATKAKPVLASRWQGVRQSRRMRVVAVAVFSLSFFSTLISFLINPPGAQAVIEQGDGLTVYGNSVTSSTTPRYRDYFENTDAFGSETNTVSGSTPLAMQVKTSP